MRQNQTDLYFRIIYEITGLDYSKCQRRKWKKLIVGELSKLRTEKNPWNNKTHECMVLDWVLNQKKENATKKLWGQLEESELEMWDETKVKNCQQLVNPGERYIKSSLYYTFTF